MMYPARFPNSISIWFGFLAAPLTWSVYYLTVYLLVEIACQAGVLRAPLFGLPVISVIVIALTAMTLIILVAAGATAYWHWRNTDQEGEDSSGRYMGLIGLLLNLLFGLLSLMMGFPALILRPCA